MKKETVIQYFKNQGEVAKALGISQPAVSKWGDIIPELSAMKLARITRGRKRNGVVLTYDPDLYEAVA